MFERFTERARQVVTNAQDEARELHHNYIGTEHLLLGLLKEEEGIGARTLTWLGVTHGGARDEVIRQVGSDKKTPKATGQIPFTPEAKRVLENSLREALSLGHNYIGTEHILLGLTRSPEGVATKVLTEFTITDNDIRNEVIRVLSGDKKKEIAQEIGKEVREQEHKYEKVKLDAKELADTILNLRKTAEALETKAQMDRIEEKLDLVIVALGELRKEISNDTTA